MRSRSAPGAPFAQALSWVEDRESRKSRPDQNQSGIRRDHQRAVDGNPAPKGPHANTRRRWEYAMVAGSGARPLKPVQE
jgi:hypothetical protein